MINADAFDGLTGAGVNIISIVAASSLQEIPFNALLNIAYACPITLMISTCGINSIEPGAFSDLTQRAGARVYKKTVCDSCQPVKGHVDVD